MALTVAWLKIFLTPAGDEFVGVTAVPPIVIEVIAASMLLPTTAALATS